MTGTTRDDAVTYLMQLDDVPAAVPLERARARDYQQVGEVLARWRDGATELDHTRFRITIDTIPLWAVA